MESVWWLNLRRQSSCDVFRFFFSYMGFDLKSLILVWQRHRFLSGFLAKGHVTRFLPDDKGDNEMIPVAVHRSYGWEKTQKTSARRPSDEGCVTSIRLKWVTYLQMRSVGWLCTSEREKEVLKERTV